MDLKKDGSKEPKTYEATVNEVVITVHNPKITGAELLKKADFKPIQCYTLFQKLKGCDFEKVAMDQVIDLSNPGIEHFITKDPDVFNYEVDGEPETTDKKSLTPNQIMKLNGINPHNHYLVQLMPNGERIDYAYCPEEPIKMVCSGMKFITEKWLEVVNIEEYGKKCRPVPPARIYKIRVDKQYYDWPDRFITIRELIELEYPDTTKPFEVYKFLSTSPMPIKLHHDEKVDLTEECLVRFTIQPKEQKDGLQCDESDRENNIIRREFSLPDEDVEFLDSLGLLWEAIRYQSVMWLVIHEYAIPEGYTVQKADIALLIAPTYSATEIDMAHFSPPLLKTSGRGISATSTHVIDGKSFQQWSRHRQAGEWRPGIDNISTHLCLVENWLIRDLER